jgi:hypothetical protein
MTVEPASLDSFVISGAHALDPILVALQDFGGGKGRIVVECYGQAWSAYWGAMSGQSLRAFIVGAEPDYIANRMWPAKQRRAEADYAYLLRIVAAVQDALLPC